jgi:hypothetical protein
VHSYRRVTGRYRRFAQREFAGCHGSRMKERVMSSVIAKQPKDTKKQTTVSLSGTVLADLELYCEFIDSARDWVINEALKAIFRRDKAFIEWKERRPGADTQKPADPTPPVPAQVQLPLETNGKPERTRLHRTAGPDLPPAA